MKKIKLSTGRYRIGNVIVTKCAPIPGRQQTTTWKNETTGEVLGYTLNEASVVARKRQNTVTP